MATNVVNITINNQLYDGQSVKVTSQNPTINWSLTGTPLVTTSTPPGQISSAIPSEQINYEVRIGTSSTNLGTNSFTGNIDSTYDINSGVMKAGPSYTYKGFGLTRGQTYYGQVRVLDAFGLVSNWSSFSFAYNALPTISDVEITPSSPSPTENIVLSYLYQDGDGDPEGATTIRWFKNGIYQRQLDGFKTVNGAYIRGGDQWVVQILPNDGYEYGDELSTAAVTILTDSQLAAITTELSNPIIVPEQPTYLDPLCAWVQSTDSSQPNVIRWYLNGEHQPNFDNLNLFRSELNIGDEVYFEAFPLVDDSYSLVTSPTVVIQEADFRPYNLKIDGQIDPLALNNSDHIFTWEVIGPRNRTQQYAHLKIGSTPGGNDVYDKTISTQNQSVTITAKHFNVGQDYYVTLYVGDNVASMTTSTSARMRIDGSKWEQTVSNSTGWTLETVFLIDRQTGDTQSKTLNYQTLRISDGSRYAEIRFYFDMIQILSPTLATVPATLTDYSAITITGQGNNILIYQNHVLIYDGTGKFLQPSSDAYLEIGNTGSQPSSGKYKSINYTTSGAYAPSSAAFNTLSLVPQFELPQQEITAVTSVENNVYIAATPNVEDASSQIYKLDSTKRAQSVPTVAKTYSPVNRISSSPDGKYKYFAHSNGVTMFKGIVIPLYDSMIDFTENQYPQSLLWKEVSTSDTDDAISSNGLTINVPNGGKWYYQHNAPGTAWFDNVDASKGWTVDFSLQMMSAVNATFAADTDEPQGLGVYVSDGNIAETIYFLGSQISLVNCGVTTSYNTTLDTQYRVNGKNGQISVFAKGPTDIAFNLILQGGTDKIASPEGNGHRPVIAENILGDSYAVWHDDGSKLGQIMVAKYTQGEWEYAQQIVGSEFNASNPAITCNGTMAYVVFESRMSNNSSLGIVILNYAGWSDPYILIDDSTGDISNPCICTDGSNNVYVVYSTTKFGVSGIYCTVKSGTTGTWSEPLLLSNLDYSCIHPSIDWNASYVVVSWTQINIGTSIIMATSKQDSGSWITPVEISQNSSLNADYSNVILEQGKAFFVWHDNITGQYQIYSATTTYGLSIVSSGQQLTNATYPFMYPIIGYSYSSNQLFVTVDGNAASGDNSPFSPLEFAPVEFNDNAPHGSAIFLLMYDLSAGVWFTSNVYGGYDCQLAFADNRLTSKPTLAKRFAENAHVIYETELLSNFEEYLSQNDNFTNVFDVVFDLNYIAVSDVVDTYFSKDLRVSGRLPRKEIRFGSFSDNVSGIMTFQKFGYYLKDAVDPFQVVLVSTENTHLEDNRTYDTLVNINGDAWIGTRSGPAFYFSEENKLAIINAGAVTNKALNINDHIIRSFAISNEGVMFVGTEVGLFLSVDHLNFIPFGSTESVVDLAYSSNGTLWIATQTGAYGLRIQSMLARLDEFDEYGSLIIPSGTIILTAATPLVCNCVTVDANNVVWVGTTSGLYKYVDDGSILTGNVSVTSLYSIQNSGMSSNMVNDIAIRNTSTRYIATSSGVNAMSGELITKVSLSDEDVLNNNVKSVLWTDPNILWAGTLSYIVQILVNDDNTYNTVVFEPESYCSLTTGLDDLHNYYTLGLSNTDINLTPNTVVEVYVNENRVGGGYEVATDNSVIRFQCPMLQGDIVRAVFREDLSKYSSFDQIRPEREDEGLMIKRVKKMLGHESLLFADTAINQTSSLFKNDVLDEYRMAFDRIALDTQPPTGLIKIVKQISKYDVMVDITYVSDNLSGVDKMIVSNWPNGTSDGTTPITPIPFTDSVIHTLSQAPIDQVQIKSVTNGSKLVVFNNSIYLGTSKPAKVSVFDETQNVWTDVATLGTESGTIDFMIVYRNALFVSVGLTGGSARLYKSTDGMSFALAATFGTSNALSATICAALLWIGASDGWVYSWNESSLTQKYNTGTTAVYAMTSFGNYLYAGTGEFGRLVKINLVGNAVNVIYTDTDTEITALGIQNASGASFGALYGGVGTKGRVFRAFTNGTAFSNTFQALEAKCQAIVPDADGMTTFVAIGNAVYQQNYNTKTGFNGWITTVTLDSEIKDIIRTTITPTENAVTDSKGRIVPTTYTYAVTETGVWQVTAAEASRKVYLRLFDRAGNETPSGTIFDSITLSDLVGFINENRLLVLDQSGNETSFLEGTEPFYSGKKIEVEQGEYYSEVFYGTNNLIAWQTISWMATTPANTQVIVEVRSGDSSDEVLSNPFVGAYNNNTSVADISYLPGKYMQFRITMTSSEQNVTPVLTQVIVEGRSSDVTHFFTTNFVLPSKMVRGIFTSNSIIPVSADVAIGINLQNSVNFNDYIIVPQEKLFTIDESLSGQNLRVGIKFVTPTRVTLLTDHFGEYGPYDSALYVNTVEFPVSTAGTYQYRITFYSDMEMTEAIFAQYSQTDPTGFVVAGTTISSGGIVVHGGQTVTVTYVPVGENLPFYCNTYYFVKIESYDGTTFTTISEGNTFVKGCNVSFVDTISFDFQNITESTKTYNFRVRAYSDEPRTTLFKTYYSGNDPSGWLINDTALGTSGISIGAGDEVPVVFTPNANDFAVDTVYYLVIDSFDGSSFGSATYSLSFRISDHVVDSYCGEYHNVPIVKNFAMMFELEDGQQVTLNLE